MQINISLNNYSFEGIKEVHVYAVNGFNIPEELPQEYTVVDMETKTCQLDLVSGTNYTLIPVTVYEGSKGTFSVRDKALRIRTYPAGKKNGYHIVAQGYDNIGVFCETPASIRPNIEAFGKQFYAYTSTAGLTPISFVFNNEVYHTYVTDAPISNMLLPINGFKANSDSGFKYVFDELSLEHVFDGETITPALIALRRFLDEETLPKNMIDYLTISADTYYSVSSTQQFKVYPIRSNGVLTVASTGVNGISFLFKETN